MQVCLFDIDGTLLSTGGAGQAAFELALVEEFAVDGGSDGIHFSGRTDRAILGDLFQRHAIPNTAESFDRFRTAYLRHLPITLSQRKGTVLPGVVDLLEQLAGDEGILVGLLTGNIRAGAETKLTHYGIWRHFACGGFGDIHVDRDEVARDAHAVARRHLRLDDTAATPVYVIGDTPHDIRCARAIGAVAVAVATGSHTAEELAAVRPDLLLEDLSGGLELRPN